MGSEAIIPTATGALVDVANPDPAVVDIQHIAHSLARICRWGGAVRKSPRYGWAIFSVAQHSLMVADTGAFGCPPEHALAALLHDAAEAYLGDLTSPVKALFPGFADLERRWALAIGERFGLGDRLAELHPVVLERDARAAATEARDLLAPGKFKATAEPFPYGLDQLAPEHAQDAFLARFDILMGGRR